MGAPNSFSSGAERAHQLQVLITRHEPWIRQFIARRSGPEVLRWTTVDDLYQETIATALDSSQLLVFGDDRRFQAWIGVIAARVVGRSLRDRERRAMTIRLKRGESSSVGFPETRVFANIPTPSSVAACSERSRAVRQAIESLPERYGKVLALYKLEEKPLDDVAAVMGSTRGATARLIARALRLLRRRLRKP
jgi:RNA polymerase sigma factor (sigma-70 family)